jgi:hypothetical protein
VLDLVLGGWDNVLFRVGTAILVLLENELLLWGLEDLMLVRALALSVEMLLSLPARPMRSLTRLGVCWRLV